MKQDNEETENAQEPKQVDEFAVMRKNIDRMRDEIRLYKRRVGETSLLAKHRCVEQLLDTAGTQCDIALNSLAAMGITLPYECFRCVLLSCSENAMLREDADAVLSREGFVTLTAMMGDSLVIVTNYLPSEGAWDAFADRLKRYLSEVEIVPLLTVIGTQKHSVTELRDSYQDALMALNTHILTEVGLHTPEKEWIMATEAAKDEERARVRFDLKQEETLGNLLKAGDAQSAVQMAKEIVEENGSISPEAVRTLFLLLMVLPFRVLDESVTSPCTDQLRATGHVDSVESMLQRISKLYRTVCDSQLKTIQNYDDHLMTWIMQYVQENVLRPDISLKLLSEEFSLSVSQISRLFKKATGTGFSEWVNDSRIEEAKRLLRGHLAPLAEIPARCGFTNDITFRRVFKKCTGMTPSDWRDIDANEQNK